MKRLEKIVMKDLTRKLLFALSVFWLVVAVYILGKALMVSSEETQENTLYSYVISADSQYKVYLKPNQLYPEGFLGENRLYSNALFDYLEVGFVAEYLGTEAAEISGNYSVEAIVEGYQGGGANRQSIYERSFLLSGPKTIEGTTTAKISETVWVALEPYRDFANNAELILGARPSRELKIVLSGTFMAKTDFGEVEEPFSYQLSLPMGTELFTITKSEPLSRQNQITETQSVNISAKPMTMMVAVLFLLIGFGGAIAILNFTRKPSEEELYRIAFADMVRKHGSRIIRLDSLPDLVTSDLHTRLADLDSLVKLADDLQRPICFCPDTLGMPTDNLLFVSDGEIHYLWEYQG